MSLASDAEAEALTPESSRSSWDVGDDNASESGHKSSSVASVKSDHSKSEPPAFSMETAPMEFSPNQNKWGWEMSFTLFPLSMKLRHESRFVILDKFPRTRGKQESGRSPAPHNLRTVLLGKTGAGKSATGNTILGRKVSGTSKYEKYSGEVEKEREREKAERGIRAKVKRKREAAEREIRAKETLLWLMRGSDEIVGGATARKITARAKRRKNDNEKKKGREKREKHAVTKKPRICMSKSLQRKGKFKMRSLPYLKVA